MSKASAIDGWLFRKAFQPTPRSSRWSRSAFVCVNVMSSQTTVDLGEPAPLCGPAFAVAEPPPEPPEPEPPEPEPPDPAEPTPAVAAVDEPCDDCSAPPPSVRPPSQPVVEMPRLRC